MRSVDASSPFRMIVAAALVLLAGAAGARAQEKGEGASRLFLTYHLGEGVGKPAYKKYFEAYARPQNDAWMAEKVLSYWGLYLNQHRAGTPWDALILYEYADPTALARRENVKEAVRVRLRSDPTWKAASDSKENIRTEDQVIVMDPIVPGR